MSPPVVKLSARGVARLRAGHPWIFRADLAPGGASGSPASDAVLVADEKGRALGSALWANEPAPIALRVYARGGAHVPFDEALVAERLDRAVARRRRWFGDAALGEDGAVRLVHAEADLLPGLFVDWWGGAAVIQSACAAMDAREAIVARLLRERHGARLVAQRDDGSVRDLEGLERRKGVLSGDGPTLVRVREAGATLELDLLADSKTGGFLDQRDNHARVGELARGEALDTFTYHGGFALAMARRATHVLAVDEDPRAVERARRNATLSGLANVEFRAEDAFATLRGFEAAGRQFDTVVVDPPALAKRRGPVEAALRAYKELFLRAIRITRRDGLLVACSCSGKVTPELFAGVLADAARDAKRDVAIVEKRGAGADHPVLAGVPETEYLKCWIAHVL